MDELLKTIITNADKLGAVAVLVLVIFGLGYLFTKGYLVKPDELIRERETCLKLTAQRDALLSAVADGNVTNAVAAKQLLFLDDQKKSCEVRITKLEAEVDAQRSTRRHPKDES